MNPLRILHLNSRLSGGGTDDQCVKLVRELNRLGQSAWLAGPEDREFSRRARDWGVPVLPTPPEGPLKLRFILAGARLIRSQRADIVHGHHGRDIWPTILAARLAGGRARIVLTRHMAKSPSSWFSRRFLLGQCDALIAVSHFVAKVLRDGVYEPASPEAERRSRPPLRGDHAKIEVIHGGVDTERFQPGSAEEQRREWGVAPEHFVFAVVGGYDRPRGKGQREFLSAAARVAARIPQARFLVVGRGNLQPTLESDIERLGLAGKAWLTPYCGDMPAAMNALDCLVHPQIGTEAFPGVVLEAAACGKPVIASALDGIPEGFAATGYGELIAPESIEGLAEAMVRWAGRSKPPEGERRQMHDRVAAQFSLAASARKVLELYRKQCPPPASGVGPKPL